MVNLIRSSGAEVLLVAVPNISLYRKAASYDSRLESDLDVPEEYDILAELQGDSSQKSDAVHFNATGYRQMAEAGYELLALEGAI